MALFRYPVVLDFMDEKPIGRTKTLFECENVVVLLTTGGLCLVYHIQDDVSSKVGILNSDGLSIHGLFFDKVFFGFFFFFG